MVIGLISVLVISLISFMGAIIFVLSKDRIANTVPYLVSLAIGALIGDISLHILPESWNGISEGISVLGRQSPLLTIGSFIIFIAIGIFVFYILEKGMHWHHSHDGDEEHHGHGRHIGPMISIADALHNFIDGIIVGLGFLVSTEIGMATAIAVIFHEIPQEISDMGLLLYAGWSRRKALFVNFISGLTAIIGFLVIWVLSIGSVDVINSLNLYIPIALAIAGGGLGYIAIVDLFPEIKKYKGQTLFKWHIITMVIGFVLMSLLLYIE